MAPTGSPGPSVRRRLVPVVLLACVLALAAAGAAACAREPQPSARRKAAVAAAVSAAAARRSTPETSHAPRTGRLVVPMLMYHHVTVLSAKAGDDLRAYTVSPDDFEAQLRYLLENGYHTVSMKEVQAYLDGGPELPAKPVMVTFDDAWEDCYSVAYPLLRNLGMKATFYVPGNWVENLDGVMSWAQIKEMADAGMEFGSHSMTHPYLTKSKASMLTWELEQSKALLEEHTGQKVTALAYPFGLYDDNVIQEAQKAGYTSGVTIEPGLWVSKDNLMTLHRINIPYWTTIDEFAMRLKTPAKDEDKPPSS